MDFYILLCVYTLAGLLGLCVGSFLNVVIYRLPLGMSLAHPGSHCTRCDYRLKWYDNIPVLSWLMLGGRCRSCHAPISPRYILVELANTALWILSVGLFLQKSPIYAIICAFVCSALICIFCIDLEHMLIHNRFVLLIAIGGAVAMFCDRFTKPRDHLIGVLLGGGVFALFYFGALLIMGREAMGFGDVKLAAAAGLLLGWQRFFLAILVGSVAGSIVLGILNRVSHRERETEYPFGPFLVGGILLALLAGEPILSWYVGLLLG